MTIHSSHPFAEPESSRDPVRRLRGRLTGTVSLWTCGSGRARAGLTVSSLMVANGSPAHALALVDPDSDFAAGLASSGTAVVQLLEWPHRDLADAFAGVAPAPGGMFTLGTWLDTRWGPLLEGSSAWAGVTLAEHPRDVGWSLLVDTVVEHIEIGKETRPLVHRRGSYVRPG
ncbi:MAG: flavin reductase family protein [Actinomycetota bacterium]|nr:flavin reductase family protein [Actinomycetota bacterium]